MEEKKKKWMKLWKPSRKTGSMAWRKSFCWCITFREMIKKRTSAAHGFCCVIAFTLTRIRCAASSAHFYNHLKKKSKLVGSTGRWIFVQIRQISLEWVVYLDDNICKEENENSIQTSGVLDMILDSTYLWCDSISSLYSFSFSIYG